jgi:large subunit ribosomal protein L4
METIIYNQKGEKSGKMELPASVFGTKWNPDLVHQVVFSMLSNKRTPVAHTKGRGEVSGGGKKPWKQKGTGRARHGSSRSPIWVGGGVTHGPSNEKVFTRKINKATRMKALSVLLSKKLKEKEVLFVDSITLPASKTKEAKIVLEALGGIKGFEYLNTKKKNAMYLALSQKDVAIERSFANFGAMSVGELRNLNILDVLNAKYLVVVGPKEALKILEAKI